MGTASTRSRRSATDPGPGSEDTPEADPSRNEVVLVGRLAAEAEERVLPSGDHLVTLRVVVPRKGGHRRRAGPGAVGRGRWGSTPSTSSAGPH